MDSSDFTHLHMHTEYSVLDGINRVDTLPTYIKDLGQNACSITDHGNISGSYKFYKSCRKAGIKPIIGMEAYYAVTDRHVQEKDDLDEPYYHLVLLAQNDKGLLNLRKLTSKSYIEGYYSKPRIDDELLGLYNEGIIATSACLGSRSSQLILNNRRNEAEKLIAHHAAIFKDRFFIEVQLHADQDQQTINSVLIDIAKRNNLPLVLTGDCHYTHPEDKAVHEKALCIQTNDVMSNPKRFSFGDIDVHVGSTQFMWAEAQKQNMPYDAIKNTSHVANMIDSDSYFSDIRNKFPTFKELPEGVTSWEGLERLSKHMLSEKFNGQPPEIYKQRLNEELNIIKKMGFSDYMLLEWKFIKAAEEIGVGVGPGRGSAGGSLVSYALNITRLDPVKHDLIFSRFLNYGRSGNPLILPKDIKDKYLIKEDSNEPNATRVTEQKPVREHAQNARQHNHTGQCGHKQCVAESGFDRYRSGRKPI